MTAQGTLDPGATVVSKPFTAAELISALNAALTKAPPRPGRSVKLADVPRASPAIRPVQNQAKAGCNYNE
jgi:DNA-binding response OmpR family regulator